jgi:hypothetical protein
MGPSHKRAAIDQMTDIAAAIRVALDNLVPIGPEHEHFEDVMQARAELKAAYDKLGLALSLPARE